MSPTRTAPQEAAFPLLPRTRLLEFLTEGQRSGLTRAGCSTAGPAARRCGHTVRPSAILTQAPAEVGLRLVLKDLASQGRGRGSVRTAHAQLAGVLPPVAGDRQPDAPGPGRPGAGPAARGFRPPAPPG